MTTATAASLAGGGHICLVVDDDRDYDDLAADFLLAGSAAGERTVLLGPSGSALRRVAPFADVVADPYVDFLGRGRLEPEEMFAMFRGLTACARHERFSRLRVVADMDWLLPAAPAEAEVLAFEVLLDRVVADLDVTVLCAYRSASFAAETLLGMACTHPTVAGGDIEPPFKLVAGSDGRWLLAGELDFACTSILAPVLRATLAAPWAVDVAALDFTDLAGMRTIAATAAESGATLDLHRASPRLRRLWRVAGLDPAVGIRFVDD